VTLEDLWGEVDPQNVPGTGSARPNWVQRLPLDLEALAVDPAIGALLARLGADRRTAELRARADR